MIKTLCLGGSFNPIHYGHLRCAAAAAQVLAYPRVLLIPNRQPPHKPLDASLASPDDRLAMCRLGAAAESTSGIHFDVDDLELRRPGPSYTIDTVRELKSRGWPSVAWLVGADMAMNLPSWHEPAALLTEAKLLVMARPGFAIDWESLPEPFRRLRQNVVPIPEIPISATDIRRRVREGLPIDDLTPPAVARYIAEHGLYR